LLFYLTTTLNQNKKKIIDDQISMPWKTLFEPSNWAFAIWGIIYLSEIVLSVFMLTLGHVQKNALKFLKQCVQNIIELQKEKIIHFDLHSHNIMVEDEKIVFIDFDLATFFSFISGPFP
jgi:serine/threonine protein kinase